MYIQCGLTTEQSMIYFVVVYSALASCAGIAIVGLEVQNNRDQNQIRITHHHSIIENSSVVANYGTSEAASEESIDTEEHITDSR